MSRTATIYKFLDSINPDSRFSTSLGVLEQTAENTIGIFVTGGNNSSRHRSLTTGKQIVRKALVSFTVNGSKKGNSGTTRALQLCEDFIAILEETANTTYQYAGNTLVIQQVDILGDVKDAGLNKMQTPVFSFDIVIQYSHFK